MAIDNLLLMQEAATRSFEHFALARRAEAERRPRDAQAARNLAGQLLMASFGHWMDRFYRRKGVPDDDAVDLTQDAMLRLVAYPYEVKTNAFALVCRARRSVFIDYLKKRGAGKRQVGTSESGEVSAEVQLSDESWDAVSESVPAERLPFELIDCVQRKLQQFRQVAGVRAEILELHTAGLSHREIAVVLYDKPESEISKREEANVRARVYDMKDQVQALFAECKD